METIKLTKMTRELCHALFRGWENDASIYADMSLYKPYVYRESAVDRYFDAKQKPSRVMLAIMRGNVPVGELQLKQIDREMKSCTLSIHLQNDAVKGRGYGTASVRMAVEYAFEELGMKAVNADTLIKNTRSQHVLEKAGVRFIKQDDEFRYYRIER